jgi:hypothetical protein
VGVPAEALARYPEPLSQGPDRPGTVDALPLGVAKLVVLWNKGKDMPQLRFIHQHDASWLDGSAFGLAPGGGNGDSLWIKDLGVSAPQEMR